MAKEVECNVTGKTARSVDHFVPGVLCGNYNFSGGSMCVDGLCGGGGIVLMIYDLGWGMNVVYDGILSMSEW